MRAFPDFVEGELRRPSAEVETCHDPALRRAGIANPVPGGEIGASRMPDTIVTPSSYEAALLAAGLRRSRRSNRRVRARASARPSRAPRSRDGLLPLQQRRDRRALRAARARRWGGSRSSTGTSTTATARRRSSGTTPRCSSSRSTSGRSIRAPAGPATGRRDDREHPAPGRLGGRRVPRRDGAHRRAGDRGVRARSCCSSRPGSTRPPAIRSAGMRGQPRTGSGSWPGALAGSATGGSLVLEGGYDAETLPGLVGATLDGLEELSGPASASDGALHRRRPARRGPRAGAHDARPARLGSGRARGRSRARRERGRRLAADPRPQNLGAARRAASSPRDQLDELAAADLEQLRRAARDDGEVLAVARLAAGQAAAVEDPVRVAPQQRREREAQELPVDDEMDARRSASPRAPAPARRAARRSGRRKRDHDPVPSIRSPSASTAVRPSSAVTRALVRTSAPAARSAPSAASPCIAPSGARREHEVARAAAREQRRADGEDPERGAHLLAAQVEPRPDEDVPEPLDRRVARSRASAGARRTSRRRAPRAPAARRRARRGRSRSGPAGSRAGSA